MSLVIAGDPHNITTPLSRTVTALTNNGSGAIRVTTSTSHLFGNGDFVRMQTATVLKSDYFYIAVIDSTHFDLIGSAFTSTDTGTAVDLSLTPQIQVPTDGDTASLQLSGMLSALKGTIDRTAALKRSAVWSNYSLFGIYQGALSAGPSTVAYSYTTPSASTWTNLTSMTGLLSFGSIVALLRPSDWLDISLTTSVNLGGVIGTPPYAMALSYELNGGGYITLPTSMQGITQVASAYGINLSWAGNGLGLSSGGDLFNIGLQGFTSNTTTNIVLFNSYLITAKHYRLSA